MQRDNNLVVKDIAGNVTWSSKTHTWDTGKHGSAKAKVLDNGHFVVLDGNDDIIWDCC